MTIYKMCAGWAKGIASGEGNGNKQWKSCNVFYEGRTIYSYGYHFPMAYIVAPNLVWLNGDRFSVSTTRHQSNLRSAIPSGVQTVIVPGTALSAAGIDYKTLEPIDVHGERTEYRLHTADVAPAGMQTNLTETVTRTDYSAPRNETGQWPNPFPKVTREEKVNAGYGDHISAWHGDTSSFPDVAGWITTESRRELVRRDSITGEFRWHTARHWLGDSVIKARDGRYFVSSFDHQESRPLYFLSQLPHAVSSVDEAIESLAPDSVKTARDMGRAVVRQGDMFAIPMDVTTRQLTKLGADIAGRRKESWRHRSVIEWHDPKAFALKWLQAEAKYVREERSLCSCSVDSDVRLGKRAYVADDGCLWHNAGKHLDTVNDELQAHLASQRWPLGRGVIRQEFGEWQDGKSANKRARDAWSSNPGSEHPAPNVRPELGDGATWSYWQDEIVNIAGRVSIMGTAHTATEVATLPDGRQFARGLMYHDPSLIGQSWRRADHRRQTLGNRKQWHLVARNTVPVSGTGSGRSVR